MPDVAVDAVEGARLVRLPRRAAFSLALTRAASASRSEAASFAAMVAIVSGLCCGGGSGALFLGSGSFDGVRRGRRWEASLSCLLGNAGFGGGGMSVDCCRDLVLVADEREDWVAACLDGVSLDEGALARDACVVLLDACDTGRSTGFTRSTLSNDDAESDSTAETGRAGS